jgi:twitching motility protein PilJ
MSTMMEKGRSIGTTAWIGLLIVSLILLVGNIAYATYRSSSCPARTPTQRACRCCRSSSRSRVVKRCRASPRRSRPSRHEGEIEDNVARLRSDYGERSPGPIEKVATTWAPLGRSADQVIGAEKTVVEFAGHADKFTAKVPQLQAQLDEVVRAMSAGGAPSSQVYIALRQVVLASTMAQRVTQIRAGGATASLAGDALKRDTDVFENVLKGLRDGGSANVQKLSNTAAVSSLSRPTSCGRT